MDRLTESTIEEFTIELFEKLALVHGLVMWA